MRTVQILKATFPPSTIPILIWNPLIIKSIEVFNFFFKLIKPYIA